MLHILVLGGTDPIEQLLCKTPTSFRTSAPAAVIAAKMIIPETEEYSKEIKLSKDKTGNNALEAISKGTTDGLRLAVNVGAMLLVYCDTVMEIMLPKTLLVHGLNNELIIANTSYTGLTMQFIVGYTFSPIAWLMGIPWDDAVLVGQLLGEKTILNEFYAYKTLGEMKQADFLL